MNFKNTILIIFSAILTFSALYAPQPLLPILSKEFNLSASTSGLIITFTLIPLSFSPFLYGIILETVSARKIILMALLLLGLSEIMLGFAVSFYQILGIRLFQGVLIPAILTSLMTYVSKLSNAENIQRVMSIYIASTIVGGFAGRAISGLISYVFNWRISFLFLGVCLIILVFFVKSLEKDVTLSVTRPKFSDILVVLEDKKFLVVFISIFLSFFCFAGLLNYLPDHLSKLSSKSNELKTGLAYSGYLMGVVVSLLSVKVIALLGYRKSLILGSTVYIMALLLFQMDNLLWIYINMFIFCGGMFMLHSVGSGFVNKNADKNKGIVNGMYVSFYYFGGIIGSYLPGLIYEKYGWSSFLILLSSMAGVILLLNLFAHKKLI
ncbi:MFS transporter [Deferribacterales bacterium Es71-Z0220]|jgi:YNFM family putative membrane transporter|uniref:MFS transporter n=1 Tax=Deferrivibrio essentukiensis TaxID=2880922 RepID=UPI001F622C60|nr:MFS transporter [Deferrivibrio essentukiensis]MCB4203623.1 MFS transporter [Deferrivibrio essentukiensis]